MRVCAFIDGFNHYHAVARLRDDRLKWLDMMSLIAKFAPGSHFTIEGVFYFSAYATWRPGAYNRHLKYVKALEASGVTTVMGKFKEKSRVCPACAVRTKSHEEKETDVNIALHMLLYAQKDLYDRGILVSADSDLAPAIRMVKTEFPTKSVQIIAPPGDHRLGELAQAAGGRRWCKRMKRIHLERSLLPREVLDGSGNLVAIRPGKYD